MNLFEAVSHNLKEMITACELNPHCEDAQHVADIMLILRDLIENNSESLELAANMLLGLMSIVESTKKAKMG